MKAEGYKFPVIKETDAMFSADTAPVWADGECCHRCRVQFGMVQRKVSHLFILVFYSSVLFLYELNGGT